MSHCSIKGFGKVSTGAACRKNRITRAGQWRGPGSSKTLWEWAGEWRCQFQGGAGCSCHLKPGTEIPIRVIASTQPGVTATGLQKKNENFSFEHVLLERNDIPTKKGGFQS
jgi:hypothetical protein